MSMNGNGQVRPELLNRTTVPEWSMPTGASACDLIAGNHNASTVNQTQLNNIHTDATGTIPVFSAVQWTGNKMSQA